MGWLCLAFSADVRERYELVGDSVKGGCVGTSTSLFKGTGLGVIGHTTYDQCTLIQCTLSQRTLIATLNQ